MSKDLVADLQEVIAVLKDGEEWQTILCKVSWNGRKVKGLDVRSYNKLEDSVRKRALIPYESIDGLIASLIKKGYGDKEVILGALEDRDNSYVSDDEYDEIFESLQEDEIKVKKNASIELVDGRWKVPPRKRGWQCT